MIRMAAIIKGNGYWMKLMATENIMMEKIQIGFIEENGIREKLTKKARKCTLMEQNMLDLIEMARKQESED